MGAFLNHRCTFAIVFADHNERATHHARRGKVGERIRGHVGAHNRFPCDSAAQRVVDAGAQHGRSGSFVGTGFHMHTEFLHQRFGLHHHIQQMRNRCALVAADIGHARLQQGLGHRQYAFTVKGLTLT